MEAEGLVCERKFVSSASEAGVVADALGASAGGILWWVLMVVNSLVWGAVLSLFVFPFIRKILK